MDSLGEWEDFLETLPLGMIGSQIQCPLCIFRIPSVSSQLLGQATAQLLCLIREEATVIVFSGNPVLTGPGGPLSGGGLRPLAHLCALNLCCG